MKWFDKQSCLTDKTKSLSLWQKNILHTQWWQKLLEHFAYLRGFSCFCWIGHCNTHKTNYCPNYLRRKESAGTMKMMDLPPQSLDLKNIEQIWSELENKLYRSIVHSKERLWVELQKAWDNISVEVLRKYIDTMPERCAAVGGHKYFKVKSGLKKKTVWLTSSDICCDPSNHLHVS